VQKAGHGSNRGRQSNHDGVLRACRENVGVVKFDDPPFAFRVASQGRGDCFADQEVGAIRLIGIRGADAHVERAIRIDFLAVQFEIDALNADGIRGREGLGQPGIAPDAHDAPAVQCVRVGELNGDVRVIGPVGL